MATRAYHIVSTYEPPDRRKEEDSGEDDEETEETWNRGFAFGLSKRITHPPKFVKASHLSAEYGGPSNISSGPLEDDDEIQIIGEQKTLGLWYKNIPRTSSSLPAQLKNSGSAEVPSVSSSSIEEQLSHAPPSEVAEKDLVIGGVERLACDHSKLPRNRRQWFISNVLQSSPAEFATPSSSSSSLSEMLARAPPPLPSEKPFVPPVWIAIGPSNRGYEMLQRSGWEEGQPLGLAARGGRKLKGAVKMESLENLLDETIPVTGRSISKPDCIKDEQPVVIDLTSIDDSEDEEDDIHASDITHEMVDMSLADSTTKTESEGAHRSDPSSSTVPMPAGSLDDSDPGARALLTPLPTILKADRLGIGLRSKHTQKVIHHSAEALKVHANAARRRRNLVSSTSAGTALGAKASARRRKRESQSRKELLAYMNAN